MLPWLHRPVEYRSDKQGYISRITAVGGNLLVRLSSRDLHNANSEIHNPTDDPICFPAENHS